MYNIDGLEIKQEKGIWIVSETIDVVTRSFTINGLEPSQDWFCPYETIKRILAVLVADKQLSEEV
jgi:hypothetical protein